MKKIWGAIPNLAVFVMVLFLLAAVMLNLPKLLQSPLHSASEVSPQSAYPPPGSTSEPVPTEESTIQAPIASNTAQPIVNSRTPVPPEGWPTDQPWPPPTSTRAPAVTLQVEPYPTVQVSYLDDSIPDEKLDSLWLPVREGKHAAVVLQELQVDDTGKRKEQPKTSHSLHFGASADLPRVTSLHISPDGKYTAYLQSETESGIWRVIDNTTGEILPEKKFSNIIVDFYDWAPDGKSFFAFVFEENPTTRTRSKGSQIDLKGNRVDFQVPDHDGIPPTITDMEVSPDGTEIADVVFYQPWSDRNNPYSVEIGLWKTHDPSVREVLCHVENGTGAQQDSLRWSPDGQKILWVGGMVTPGEDAFVNWLWIADRATGNCEPIVRLGIHAPGLWVSGGFTAGWSPDGSQIAFRLKEDAVEGDPDYKIVLLNVETRSTKDLTHPTKDVISNVQFSANGDLVVYNLSGPSYGEIWAVNLTRGEPFPVAGPTTLFAPFDILQLQ